jgi:hypothetical protein
MLPELRGTPEPAGQPSLAPCVGTVDIVGEVLPGRRCRRFGGVDANALGDDTNRAADEQVHGTVDTAAAVPTAVGRSIVAGDDLDGVVRVVVQIWVRVDTEERVSVGTRPGEPAVDQYFAILVDAFEPRNSLS